MSSWKAGPSAALPPNSAGEDPLLHIALPTPWRAIPGANGAGRLMPLAALTIQGDGMQCCIMLVQCLLLLTVIRLPTVQLVPVWQPPENYTMPAPITIINVSISFTVSFCLLQSFPIFSHWFY